MIKYLACAAVLISSATIALAQEPVDLSGIECPAENPPPPAWGLYRQHPTDCTKFIQCAWGNAIVMDCPEGLIYNHEVKHCDWPSNTTCETPAQ